MNSRELYLRLLSYVKPYRRTFALSIFATMVLAATEPAMPALLKPLLDGSFVNKDPTYVVIMPLLLVGLFIIRGVAGYVSTVAITEVANNVVRDLRSALFANLIALPNRYFDDHPTGNLLSKLNYDVSQVTSAATNVLVTLVRDSLAVAGLLAWMFYLNWKLSFVFFVAIPIIGLIVKTVSSRMRMLNRQLQQAMGDMTHILEEAISGNKVMKIFGGQPYEQQRYDDSTNHTRKLQMKIARIAAANVPVVQLVTVSALGVIVYLASLQSLEDKITVGSFVSFFGAMAMLFSPVKRLTSLNEQLQRGLAAAQSVFELLDEPREHDAGAVRLTQPVAGRVEFADISVRYDDVERPALQRINLIVNAGETVALVGASGSGKTTLVNLLPRFYAPTTGTILIDGIDIRDIALTDLRRNIAFVDQNVILFNDTVAANIAYGALSDMAEPEIRRAADAAHVTPFVDAMTQGFQTLIGQDGVRLSGGQRQRLAIARAILKNAPILILDEATSALDTESERHIQQALETLKKGKTTIVIAHRLSTIQHADRIVVLDKGEIIEQGTHRQLLNHGGVYAKLYRLQFADQEQGGEFDVQERQP